MVLDSEDPSVVLNNFYTQSFKQFGLEGLTYEFITSFFFEYGKVKECYYVDKGLANLPKVALSMFNFQNIFDDQELIGQLTKGEIVMTEKISRYIYTTFVPIPETDFLIMAPILKNGKLLGIQILATQRTPGQVSTEEKELIQLMSNLIGVSFKLVDSEKSLTEITQQVYKMNAELHDLDKLKDDFVSIASHELRTPMTAIRSYAWMALYKSDVPLSEKLKRYLTRTLVSTERLIDLVNDMLNISRIESGRVEIIPTAFNMLDLVNDVALEVEPKAKEKNITVQVFHSQIPQAFADPDKVHQVLLNLVGNALKFTPENGTITVSFFSDGISLETSVKDSGVGISADDLSRLFKKFGRLDNSYVAAATSGGTGLGLYICKSLVELMKGKIWAKSDGTGKGAIFTFSLPVATEKVLAEAEQYTKKVSGEAKMLEPTHI